MSQGNQLQQALQLHSARNYQGAEEIYRRILETDKDDAYVLACVGECAWEDARYTEALDHYGRSVIAWEGLLRRSIRIPDEVLLSYPLSLKALGRVEEAIEIHRMIRRAYPFSARNRFSFGMCLLLTGNFEEGWPEFEYRWGLGTPAKVVLPLVPEWQGEPPNGKTILLYGREGVGDVIQMMRFIPHVAAAGANVVLALDPPLQRLARMLDAPFKLEHELGPDRIDYHYPITSLPRFCCPDVVAIPSAPYLRAPVQACDIRALPGLKVGIVWAGGAALSTDKRRSMPLLTMLPILKTPGCSFLSLQVGPPDAQRFGLPRDIMLPSMRAVDWGQTAVVIDALDLVVTVDTGVAHLAGALGKPVWMLSRYNGDWRWLRDRLDSPWYPSMRIFRQAFPGEWEPVIAEVAAELRKLAER